MAITVEIVYTAAASWVESWWIVGNFPKPLFIFFEFCKKVRPNERKHIWLNECAMP